MNNSDSQSKPGFPRRQFLRGAVAVAGASVLGRTQAVAIAQSLQKKQFALSFWTGQTFIPADRPLTGDSTLDHVQITLHGYGSGPLKYIDTEMKAAASPSSPAPVFHAWTAPPAGGATVRFVMPVQPEGGISLILHAGETSHLQLSSGAGLGPKLQQGVFVLAPEGMNLNTLQFDATTGRFEDATFQHVVMRIEQA